MNDNTTPLYAGQPTPPAPLTSDERYWLRIRPQVIAALAEKGWEIWSDKDRVWLHPCRPASGSPIRCSTESQRESLQHLSDNSTLLGGYENKEQ